MQTLKKWKIHVPLFAHPRKTRSPIHLCIFANNDIWEIFYEDLWSVSMEGKILQSFIYIYIYIYVYIYIITEITVEVILIFLAIFNF